MRWRADRAATGADWTTGMIGGLSGGPSEHLRRRGLVRVGNRMDELAAGLYAGRGGLIGQSMEDPPKGVHLATAQAAASNLGKGPVGRVVEVGEGLEVAVCVQL